ncbi:MAG: TIGR03557 family F420-dependent LLM class oxidoreductase [Candidatus Saccharimonadia bacterium]
MREIMAQIYWFLADEQFQPEVIVKHAIAAEKADFDGVLLSEHFHPWVEDLGTSGFAFAILGAIAQATQKIKLATAVTTPLYRFHPAVVAQAAATIDRLSQGRFTLGVGTGENINEGPLGFELPAYKERSARLEEALEIMNRLLSGETLSFSGIYYQTKDAKLYSPPLKDLPIYVAAGGPKSATLAARSAQGLITSVKDIDDALERVIKPAKTLANGKDFKVITTRWSVYADSEDSAWEALLPQRGLRAPSRALTHIPKVLQEEADLLNHDEVLAKYHVLANAEDFLSTYSPLVTKLGADIVGIQATSLNQLELIKMLGKDVVPKLKQLVALKEER